MAIERPEWVDDESGCPCKAAGLRSILDWRSVGVGVISLGFWTSALLSTFKVIKVGLGHVCLYSAIAVVAFSVVVALANDRR